MATEHPSVEISRLAASDLSASQFCAVTLNSSGKLALASAGATALGLLQDKPEAADRAGLVAVSGVTKAKAGGSWSLTSGLVPLTPGTGGKLVEAGTGDVVLAVALEASGGDGEVVTVLLRPQHEPIV